AAVAGSSGPSCVVIARRRPKVNAERASARSTSTSDRSRSLRIRRRFGVRGFRRKSRKTPASVAPVGISDLTRNAVDVLPAGGLEAKLKLGRPLRVKLGIDVTSPDIHVGRAIPLQRMRAFQDEGHNGGLISGE